MLNDYWRLATSNQPQNSVVSFGLGEHQVKAVQVEGKEYTEQVQKLTIDLRAVKSGMWWNKKASTRYNRKIVKRELNTAQKGQTDLCM